MPLLYGEGEKAFVLLQEAILNSSEDQSLFTWSPVRRPSTAHGNGISVFAQHLREIASFRGVFSTMPIGEPAALTSKGVRANLYIVYMKNAPPDVSDPTKVTPVFLAVLDCVYDANASMHPAIVLRRYAADANTHTYIRHESEAIKMVKRNALCEADVRQVYLRRQAFPPAISHATYRPPFATPWRKQFQEARVAAERVAACSTSDG